MGCSYGLLSLVPLQLLICGPLKVIVIRAYNCLGVGIFFVWVVAVAGLHRDCCLPQAIDSGPMVRPLALAIMVRPHGSAH